MTIIRNIFTLSMIIFALASCTTNEVMVRVFYEKLDDTIVEEFSEYAEFSKKQRKAIEAAAVQYHIWHRETQLPQYGALLRTIRADINSGETLARTQIQEWTQRIDEMANAATTCHPINQAADFLSLLTDKQVNEIEATIERKLEDDQQKDLARRFADITKWASRIGLNLDQQQRAIIQTTLDKEENLYEEKYELWADWAEAFIAQLRQRRSVGFRSSMQIHIRQLWQLAEDAYPDELDRNRALWIDALHQIFALQTPEQRNEFSNWLNDMANVLDRLSDNSVEVAALDTGRSVDCGLL